MYLRVERGARTHEAHPWRSTLHRRDGRRVRSRCGQPFTDVDRHAVDRRSSRRLRPHRRARPLRSGRSVSPSTGRRTPTTPASTSPQANGWYDQAGVDLQILPYASTTPEALIAAGQAECGISFQDALTFAAAAGAPIVSVMAILQHTAQEIAVLASSRHHPAARSSTGGPTRASATRTRSRRSRASSRPTAGPARSRP